nr:MAG TPA: hypothetical protein [Caudoviricetes sp.]
MPLAWQQTGRPASEEGITHPPGQRRRPYAPAPESPAQNPDRANRPAAKANHRPCLCKFAESPQKLLQPAVENPYSSDRENACCRRYRRVIH